MTAPPRWPGAYDVLHVNHEAGAEELEEAYVDRLAEVRDPAGRRAVTEAWAVLGDPERRAAYDRQAMAPLPMRELAAAVRGLLIALAIGIVGAVAFAAIGADVRSIVAIGVLTGAAVAGWRALERPWRWLELDRYQAGWLVRVILAVAIGLYAAPFVIGWPLLRALMAAWPELVPRLRALRASVGRAGR